MVAFKLQMRLSRWYGLPKLLHHSHRGCDCKFLKVSFSTSPILPAQALRLIMQPVYPLPFKPSVPRKKIWACNTQLNHTKELNVISKGRFAENCTGQTTGVLKCLVVSSILALFQGLQYISSIFPKSCVRPTSPHRVNSGCRLKEWASPGRICLWSRLINVELTLSAVKNKVGVAAMQVFLLDWAWTQKTASRRYGQPHWAFRGCCCVLQQCGHSQNKHVACRW